jgi:hypothetical protein
LFWSECQAWLSVCVCVKVRVALLFGQNVKTLC